MDSFLKVQQQINLLQQSLHIESSGTGPDLVLLHGWGLHGGIWSTIVDVLSKKYRVHVIDLPGHGYSPSRLVNYNLDSVTDVITTTLDALSIKQAIFVGWSLGGLITLNLALRQSLTEPQWVKKIILVACTPRFTAMDNWTDAVPADVLDGFMTSLKTDYRTTLRRFLALQVRGGDDAKEDLRKLREQVFSRGEPDARALQGALNILQDTDLRNQLTAINQSTLLVGGKRDTLVPSAALIKTAEKMPDARVSIIEGAAHAPFISHPKQFIESVMAFVNNG